MAHGDALTGAHDLLSKWGQEPIALFGLAIVAVTYARGRRAQRACARRGRRTGTLPPAPRRSGAFLGAWLALFVALVSPVDPLGEALFAGHMVQHLLLTLVAAPLLAFSDAGTTLLWAFPLRLRRAIGRVIASPPVRRLRYLFTNALVAWTLHAATIALWHTPALYDLAVANDAAHALEHTSFLVTALLFWWPLLSPRRRARLEPGLALFYLFTATIASALLGAAISMAGAPWYAAHAATAPAWGLSALEDQQLAGLIMWVPAGFVYLGAAVSEVLRMLRSPRASLLSITNS
jgi:putative membrane protein